MQQVICIIFCRPQKHQRNLHGLPSLVQRRSLMSRPAFQTPSLKEHVSTEKQALPAADVTEHIRVRSKLLCG